MDSISELEKPVRKAPTTEPRYQIVPLTDRVSVTRGETATFSVYLTGYGEFERQKISIFLDYDTLLSSKGGTISIPFAQDGEGSTLYGKPAIESDNQFKHSIESNSATMFLSNLLFIDSPAFEFPSDDNAANSLYPTIIGEGDWGNHAPIEVELNIADDVKPGDYNFQMYFMYSDYLDSYHRQSNVKIHVQSKVEEYEPWPQRAAIFAGIIALLSLIYQTGLFSFISSVI